MLHIFAPIAFLFQPFRASEVPSTMISLNDRPVVTKFCTWSASKFAEPTSKVGLIRLVNGPKMSKPNLSAILSPI